MRAQQERSKQQKYPNGIIRMSKRRLAEKLNRLSDVLDFLDFRVEKNGTIFERPEAFVLHIRGIYIRVDCFIRITFGPCTYKL